MNENMHITTATLDDISALSELLTTLFSQEQEFKPEPALQQQGLTAIVTNPAVGEVFVVRENNHVIAMITVLYSVSTALGAKVAFFEDMVVTENARGEGVGSALIQYAIQHVTSIGCQRISLLTDDDNQLAQQFYHKHGFEHSQMQLFRKMLT